MLQAKEEGGVDNHLTLISKTGRDVAEYLIRSEAELTSW